MLSNLNEKQKAAVVKTEGANLVIASAGTGKTEVLAKRVMYMLQSDQHITPNMILLLTFTEIGVVAMRKRLVEFIGAEAYKITISTYHGWANTIIQQNPSYFGIRNHEPATELDLLEIAYKIIDELPMDNSLKRMKGDLYYDSRRFLNLWSVMDEESFDLGIIAAKIKEYLDDLPNREEFIYKRGNSKKGIEVGDVKQAALDKEINKMTTIIEVAKLHERYKELLHQKERYTFSQMIIWLIDAWKRDDFFLLTLQERFMYVLVDEFGDTNRSQLEMINTLLNYWENPNIFAVGDFRQILFEFSGARIKNISDFADKYNPEIFILNDNYRSNQFILNAATNIINNSIHSLTIGGSSNEIIARTDKGNIKPVVLSFSNLATETAYVADLLEERLKKGIDLSEIAVLYRKHKQVDDLVNQLDSRGIPYYIKRRVNVLDQVIIRQIVDIITFIVKYDNMEQSSYDALLFKILHFAFLNNDHSKIHKYYLTIQDKESRSRKPVDIIETEKILNDLIKTYHNQPVLLLVSDIMQLTGLMKWALTHTNKIQLLLYITTYVNWIKSEAFKNPSMTGVDIIGLLDKMKANGLYLSALDLQGNSKGVNLTTIHGAKGAEYDTVIMFGCTRNEWEASRSPATSYKLPDTLLYNTPEDKIETGRKIFYVAATRARRELIITYANKTTDGKSLEPTQFIAESKLPTTIITDVNIDKYLELQFCKKQIAFDLDKILIKERLSEFQMSASAFIKYLRCPITFYMENVLRVPSIPHPALLYGNAIHLALSKLFNAARGNVEMTLLLVIQIFDDYMQKRKHQISKIDYNLRIKLGHDALTHYYNEVYREANKITLNEYTIKNVLINGVPSKGIVDKMEFHGNGVNIVDYKTGSIISAKAKIKGPSEKVPNGGDYWIQGIFNELLMDNNTTKVWKFESFALGMVEADNYTVLPMIASREEKFMISRLVKEVYDKIMDTQFFDGCDDPDCYYCNLLKK